LDFADGAVRLAGGNCSRSWECTPAQLVKVAIESYVINYRTDRPRPGPKDHALTEIASSRSEAGPLAVR